MIRTELWCDGSGTPRGPIGWAWILRAINTETGQILAEKRGAGSFPDGTNNRAELMAVIEGLLALNTSAAVTVYSDSQYIVDTVRKGTLALWLANGWTLTSHRSTASKKHTPRGPAECSTCGATGDRGETCGRHDPPSCLVEDYDSCRVRNRDLWQMIASAMRFHRVVFELIPGHAGHELNEDCDRRAGEARRALLTAGVS